MPKTDFHTPKMEECSFCGCWFKEKTKKCPRCFTPSSPNYIVDTWRNYKNTKSLEPSDEGTEDI